MRQFEAWLNLFTDDCYYTMILREDFVKNNNMVAIGEDKRKLQGRIEVAENVESEATTHLLSAILLDSISPETIEASLNFVVYRKTDLTCTGRYYFSIVPGDNGYKISSCTAVLNNDVIHGTIYLPV